MKASFKASPMWSPNTTPSPITAPKSTNQLSERPRSGATTDSPNSAATGRRSTSSSTWVLGIDALEAGEPEMGTSLENIGGATGVGAGVSALTGRETDRGLDPGNHTSEDLGGWGA